jgi:acetoin utilization deacetylase AcuC-like enzyme
VLQGEGFTVNLPLEVGAVDEDYRWVSSEVILPVLRQFQPDLILVSAGFDAHARDPLAGMRLTTAAFAAMTMDLRQAAEECCGGRIVTVTEGGYDLPALADSLQAVVGALAADRPDAAPWPARDAVPPVRGRAAAAAARAALARYWRL